MNDVGLSMGESTCASKITAKSCTYNGQRLKEKNCALMSVNELTRLAMERTSKARQAIELMGKFAED